jgi:hypothetical protein
MLGFRGLRVLGSRVHSMFGGVCVLGLTVILGYEWESG